MDTYEKKYREALERARIWQKHLYDTNDRDYADELNYIFPELKDSEDWKIRETLIRFHKSTIDIDGIKGDDIIAWLEKQGEKKSLTIDIKSMVDSYKQRLIKNGGVNNSPLVNMCVEAFQHGVENTLDELHLKQILANSCKTCKDEQKLFDYENANIHQKDYAPKEEPKFKVGDWIINRTDATIMQIVNNKDFYESVEIGGQRRTDTYNYLEWDFRLWTIQDAKDGDVLCLYYNNRKTFFIFKAIIGEGDYADILVHCCYTGKYQYLKPSFNGECRMHQISDGGYCLPADKEEQDILFQKMKEAGYEWDDEKKELKKISQRMISAEAKEAMYDKPAWSEEDKDILYNTLSNLTELKDLYGKDYGKVGKCIDWLKSFKERIEKQ